MAAEQIEDERATGPDTAICDFVNGFDATDPDFPRENTM